MSRIQTSYVDYANLGDTGANTAAAIQPLQPGEAASAPNLGRAAENVRSRTEIARDVVEDLLYYRDYGGRYVLDTAGGGTLAWEVGAAGRVHNDTTLTIRPFIGPRTNIKGVLRVGTATLTQVIYTVANTAYASDGMNRVTVEHRSVPGTSPVTVTISAGPVYNILVVFDASNGAHDAATVSGLVSSAIAGHSFLAGKIVVTTSATPGLAILATAGRVPLSTRVHAAGTTGNATADLEEHVLAAGALNTFTTTYPLVEGSVLAIRYDYNVEPSGSDPNDPKGGVPGGRSESNASRSSTDVSANLFRVHDYPEWIPGCIPLCKVVHGRLVWCDGTILASGTSGTPGSTYATHISPGAFSGLPTQVVNGGIDNGGDPVIQDTFVSVDERLSQSRYATWTTTDGTNSTGGHYNGVGAVTSAVAACTNGGTIVVRRGAYTTGLPAITITSGGLSLRGETHDNTLTSRTRITAAASNTVNADVTLENLAYLRTGNVRTDLARNVTLRNVTLQAGALAFGYGAGYKARLENVTMLNSVSTGTHNNAALEINSRSVHATNCEFTGPDPLSASNTPVVWQGNGTTEALYENCIFRSTKAGSQPFAFEAASGNTTFVNCTFSIEGAAGTFALDLSAVELVGTARFIGCRFVNATGVACVRVRHTSGNAVFENCTLHPQGSPSGVPVTEQSTLVVAPAPSAPSVGVLARAVLVNTTLQVAATNFTGMTTALVHLGHQDVGGTLSRCQGQLAVRDLVINMAVGTGHLPPRHVVMLSERAEYQHTFDGITVHANNHVFQAAAIGALDGEFPFLVHARSVGDTVLRASRIAILGVSEPDVNTIPTGCLYANNAIITGVDVVPSAAYVGALGYGVSPIHLVRADVARVRMVALATVGVSQISCYGSAGRRSVARDVLWHAPAAYGSQSVLYLNGGVSDGLVIRNDAQYNYPVFLLDATTISNDILNTDVDSRSRNIAAVGSLSVSAGIGARIENNRILTGRTVGLSFFDLGDPAPLGTIISGNIFSTGGATAAACVPDLSVTTGNLSLVRVGNTFATSANTPR